MAIFFVGQGFSLAASRLKGLPYENTIQSVSKVNKQFTVIYSSDLHLQDDKLLAVANTPKTYRQFFVDVDALSICA